MTRLSMTLGAIAALALGACGGGDDNDGSADATVSTSVDAGVLTDAEPTPDAAPQRTALEELCAPDGAFDQLFGTLRECGGAILQFELSGTDLLTGESLQSFCLDQFGPMVEDGTISVARDALAACSSYATATACDELDFDTVSFSGTPCEAILVGSVAIDGDCEESAQCAGDAFCGSGAICNTCTPRLADTAACGFDDQCTSGTCNSQGVCAAPVGLGGACIESGDCVGLLECDDTDTCVSIFPAQGDPCFSTEDCSGPQGFGIPFDIGLYCAPPVDKGPGTCEVAPVIGDTCLPEQVLGIDLDLDQDVCNIFEYEWCDEGTCAAPAISGVGESCNIFAVTGSGARRCESGLICANPVGGIDGQPLSVCQTAGDVGDTCDDESPCLPFFSCDEGVCVGSEYEGICPAPKL